MFGVGDFWLETRVIIKISTHPWYPRIFDQISWGWRQKIIFFETKNLNRPTQNHNSQNCFEKMSWISPWVSRINWCEWHWCGSTYMAMRLSGQTDRQKKHFLCFRLFLHLPRTASQQYGVSHINAIHINQSYWPKNQSMKFSQIFFENWRFWKTQFFWVSYFLTISCLAIMCQKQCRYSSYKPALPANLAQCLPPPPIH